jgi:hypothetical protein
MATSIARIASTIIVITSTVMAQLLEVIARETRFLDCLQHAWRWPSQDYLFAAAAAGRGCALLPSTRLTGGLTIT